MRRQRRDVNLMDEDATLQGHTPERRKDSVNSSRENRAREIRGRGNTLHIKVLLEVYRLF